MSKSSSDLISDLTPDMQVYANTVYATCKERGIKINIYGTFRSLEDQAALYCAGATHAQVDLKIDYLRNTLNMDALADILEAANDAADDSTDGPVRTKGLPGFSWHAFGEAFDAVPMLNGKCVWDYKTDKEKALWDIYGQAVRDSGLYWAGDWKHFVEKPHAQLRLETNPLKCYRPGELIKALRAYGAL